MMLLTGTVSFASAVHAEPFHTRYAIGVVSLFPVEYTSTPVRKDDEVIGSVVVFKDITERRQAEEELQKLAVTDPLTGLPNRRHFLQIAEKETAWSLRYQHLLSVAVMDLDHFKAINDMPGHAKGDEVLIEIGRICQNAVRGPDVFARFGGEEFAAPLPMTTLGQSEALGTGFATWWQGPRSNLLGA